MDPDRTLAHAIPMVIVCTEFSGSFNACDLAQGRRTSRTRSRPERDFREERINAMLMFSLVGLQLSASP